MDKLLKLSSSLGEGIPINPSEILSYEILYGEADFELGNHFDGSFRQEGLQEFHLTKAPPRIKFRLKRNKRVSEKGFVTGKQEGSSSGTESGYTEGFFGDKAYQGTSYSTHNTNTTQEVITGVDEEDVVYWVFDDGDTCCKVTEQLDSRLSDEITLGETTSVKTWIDYEFESLIVIIEGIRSFMKDLKRSCGESSPNLRIVYNLFEDGFDFHPRYESTESLRVKFKEFMEKQK